MQKIPTRISWSIFAGALSIGLFVSTFACGSSSGGGSTAPTPVTVVSRSTGNTGPIGATVTITGAGVSPSSVTIGLGQSVTFVNNDNRSHEIASNPHPQHGSCPSIEGGLAVLSPGQTKSTQGFADSGTCGYHDHLDATNASYQGTIRIQ
jgi:plastocyanin